MSSSPSWGELSFFCEPKKSNMKRFLCLALSLMVLGVGIGQVNHEADKAYYLQKKKNQQITGFVLLGAGATAVTIALITLDPFSESSAGAVALIGGGAAMVASVPFFIAADKNKQKANALSAGVGFERFDLRKQQPGIQPAFPALSVRLNIR
jgi:hypothetical protein